MNPFQQIEVVRINPLSTSGSLQATASVRIGGALTLHDFRVIQQPGQEPWVSVPQREYSKNGERRWTPIVELKDGLMEAVSAAILEKVAELPK